MYSSTAGRDSPEDRHPRQVCVIIRSTTAVLTTASRGQQEPAQCATHGRSNATLSTYSPAPGARMRICNAHSDLPAGDNQGRMLINAHGSVTDTLMLDVSPKARDIRKASRLALGQLRAARLQQPADSRAKTPWTPLPAIILIEPLANVMTTCLPLRKLTVMS